MAKISEETGRKPRPFLLRQRPTFSVWKTAVKFMASYPGSVPQNYPVSKDLGLLGAVRAKPGMHIGGIDERALHACVFEVLANSINEFLAGCSTHIEVRIHGDGSISIRDNRRGIPVDPEPEPGVSMVEFC
jgi:DNA gyrase subunit B